MTFLSRSQAWPSNLEAIGHLKTAFYIRFAKLLQSQHKITCNVMDDALDVEFQDYVFRFTIHVVSTQFLFWNVIFDPLQDTELAVLQKQVRTLQSTLETLRTTGSTLIFFLRA